MRLFVNGEAREAPAGTTLAALLEALGAPREGVAVELNQCLVRRAEWPTRALAEGDRVEVVGLVGGG